MGAISTTGSNGTQHGTGGNNGVSGTNPMSQTITTANGNMTIACWADDGGTAISSTSATQDFVDNAANGVAAAMNHAASSSGSNTMTCTLAAADVGAFAGFDVIASGGAAAQTLASFGSDQPLPSVRFRTTEQGMLPVAALPQIFLGWKGDFGWPSKRTNLEEGYISPPYPPAIAKPSNFFGGEADNFYPSKSYREQGFPPRVPPAPTQTPSQFFGGEADQFFRRPYFTELGDLPLFQAPTNVAPPNGWLGPGLDQLFGRRFVPPDAAPIVFPPPPTLTFLAANPDQWQARRLFTDVAGFIQQPPVVTAGWMGVGDQAPPRLPVRAQEGPLDSTAAVLPPTLVSGIAWAYANWDNVVSRPQSWLLSSTALSPQVIIFTPPTFVEIYYKEFFSAPGTLGHTKRNP